MTVFCDITNCKDYRSAIGGCYNFVCRYADYYVSKEVKNLEKKEFVEKAPDHTIRNGVVQLSVWDRENGGSIKIEVGYKKHGDWKNKKLLLFQHEVKMLLGALKEYNETISKNATIPDTSKDNSNLSEKTEAEPENTPDSA